MPLRWRVGTGIVVLLAAAAFVAGCASVAPLAPAAGASALSGRLAIRIEADGATAARNFSAAFDLRGDSRLGTLALSTPLGSTLAQAHWAPGTVFLATAQGRRDFGALDDLTREVLGESVPVEAWFDWLRGRPWQGADSRADTPPEPPGFQQLGWTVDLSRFADGRVVASRERPPPAVSVRIQLDAS